MRAYVAAAGMALGLAGVSVALVPFVAKRLRQCAIGASMWSRAMWHGQPKRIRPFSRSAHSLTLTLGGPIRE